MANLMEMIGRLKGYRDLGRAAVLAEADQAITSRQQQPQASALARLLAARGMQGTPDAQTAVRMMMDPASRGAGIEMASGLIGTAQELERIAAMQQPGVADPVQIGEPSFSDFTPESMYEYQQTGDPRTLRYRPDHLGQQRIDLAIEKENRLRQAQGRLPVGVLESIIEDESIKAGYEAAQDDMRPEYFGWKSQSLGELVLEAKARFGDEGSVPMVQYWNELESQQAQRRHALFGATLTEGEQAAWNRIAIKPSDSMAGARAKLEAQMNLLRRKAEGRNQLLRQQGYQAAPPEPADLSGGRPPLGSFVR